MSNGFSAESHATHRANPMFDHYFRFCPSLLSFGSTILLKILVYSYIVKHIHITVIYILHIYTNMYAQLARLDINFVVAASVRK